MAESLATSRTGGDYMTITNRQKMHVLNMLIEVFKQKGTNLRNAGIEAGIPANRIHSWLIWGNTDIPEQEDLDMICNKVGIPSINLEEFLKNLPEEESAEKNNTPDSDNVQEKLDLAQDKTSDESVSEDKPKRTRKKTEPVKTETEEKEFAGMPAPVIDTEKTEEKPIQTKPVKTRKEKGNILFEAEQEAYIRTSLGLKKSEPLTYDSICVAMTDKSKKLIDEISKLRTLATIFSQKCFKMAEEKTDETTARFAEALKSATPKGVELALDVLKNVR